MFRTQPRGFRWLVGGFALAAAVAFGVRFLAGHDRPALLFGLICLALAGYWLIFDREPGDESGEAGPENG